MSYIIVSDTDGSIKSGPTAAPPASAPAGSSIIACPLGFPDTMRWVPAARGFQKVGDTYAYNASTRTYVESLPKVQDVLVAQIKAEAERRKMMVASPGGYKKAEYAAKEREVNAWESLAGTAQAILLAFNAMTAARKATAFPFAIASAAAFGDQPADAIARFKAGISRASIAPKVAATEERVCALIRAATTIAAARAAAAAVVWPS